jgi:hypothetical protein
MGESIIGRDDICTKALPGGQKRDHLIGLLLHAIVDWTSDYPPR